MRKWDCLHIRRLHSRATSLNRARTTSWNKPWRPAESMTPPMNRRAFLQAAAGALAVRLPKQSQQNLWPSPVIDAHFHFRATDAALQHMDGAGIARAVLLTAAAQDSRAAAAPAARFTRFTSADVTQADA